MNTSGYKNHLDRSELLGYGQETITTLQREGVI